MPADDRGSIDLEQVLRRARRRRRPRVIAAIAGGIVAVAAVATPVVAISLPAAQLGASSGSAGSAASAPDHRSSPSAAAIAPRCGAPLPSASSAVPGLAVAVPAITAVVGSAPIPIGVTLTNTGGTRLTGSVVGVALTLSRDATVLWHGTGSDGGAPFALDPGASTTLPATLQVVACDPAGDGGSASRTDVPPAPAGEYRVTATLEVLLDGGGDHPLTVTGPAAALTVR